MKTIARELERKPYEAPRAEIIQNEKQSVLCASGATGLKGNSTESVTTQTFIFP